MGARPQFAQPPRAADHVNETPFDAEAYMDSAAAALALPIPLERRDAVAANLARLHALAQEILTFEPAAPTDPDGT
jgi:hypothetical protein